MGFLFLFKNSTNDFNPAELESTIKSFIAGEEMKFGEVFPVLRIAVSGTMKGPDLFSTLSLLGKEIVIERLDKALLHFKNIEKAKTE